MNTLKISAGVAAIAAVLATSAQASELVATWTENGETASWSQAFTPASEAPIDGYYTQIHVWNYSDTQGSTESSVTYFSATPYGGGWQDALGDFNVSGVVVYGGTEINPTFTAGTYAGTDSITNASGTLTLTASSAPEPAAWAMMLVGFGLAGSIVRRRRSVAA